MAQASVIGGGNQRWAAWLAALVASVLIVYGGAGLAAVLSDDLGGTTLGVVSFVVLVVLGARVGKWLADRHGRYHLLHLLWATVILGMVLIGVPVGHQWLLIPLFAALGFASVPLLGPIWGTSAIVIAPVVAGIIGGIDPVAMTGMALSAVVGGSLAAFGRQQALGESAD